MPQRTPQPSITALLTVIVFTGGCDPARSSEGDASTMGPDAGVAADSATPMTTTDAGVEVTPRPRADAGALMIGTWRDITPPGVDPSATPCTDVQFDPSAPDTIYAYYGGQGIYRSTDAGGSWTLVSSTPMLTSLGRVRIDPRDGEHMYAIGSVGGPTDGFWVSHDRGATWSIPAAFAAGAAGGQWNYDVYNIAVDPTDFDHFILSFHSPWSCCGDDAGVVESTDGGVTFVAHAPIAGMNHAQGITFLHDPSNGIGNTSTWLVGGGYTNGLFRTVDGGASWTRVPDLHDNHGGFDAHYSAQGYLYIGVEGGIARSTDNGASWEMAAEGVPYNWYYGAISDGRFLYTSTAFVGVASNQPFLKSQEGGADEGETWTQYSDQALPAGPWRMVFEPENRVIYSANWSGGTWALSVGP